MSEALAPPPSHSAGAAPVRRPASIRRTSSIEADWPDGLAGGMRLLGRARDAVTPRAGGPPMVCAQDEFLAGLDPQRTILEIAAAPARPGIEGLVGARASGQLRRAIGEILPDEARNATPLHLLLDDIAGASLVAGWAWSRHRDDWREMIARGGAPLASKSMENICAGFRTGSAALLPQGGVAEQNFAMVVDLRNPDDPDGWHPFTDQAGAGLRRARRIDIWIEGEVIAIDAAFQDSASTPDGGRATVHEYHIAATADLESLRLLSIQATPRILPYAECPAAAMNAARMVGGRLVDFRTKVLEELRGAAGCTHLNDALRALAETPVLVERLTRALAPEDDGGSGRRHGPSAGR